MKKISLIEGILFLTISRELARSKGLAVERQLIEIDMEAHKSK